MSYKWDDELTEKFLTLYRKHKCLWNPYSPNYRNCNFKNEAFKTVVQELNVPGIRISECLQQIEVVREKYKQEQLKTEKELKSGKLYTSKVPWFNLMSQMLCEVINDEENFSEEPVKILSCTVKDQKSEDPKPEKYVESKSKQLNPNASIISKEDTNGPWNRCPSYCGWEEEKSRDGTQKGAKQFNDCKERGVQIDPEIEVPLRFEKTNILDTINRIEEVNQPTPLYANEINDSNWKMRRQESDVIQNRKRVQINAGIEPQSLRGCKGKWDSTQPTKFNVTEDKTPPRDDTEALNTLQVMSLKENNVQCPRMCSNHIAAINQSQYLENQLRNLEINQTNHRIDEPRPNSNLYRSTLARQSQQVSKFEDETDGRKDADRCNLCVRKYGEKSKKYSTISGDDKYEVSSRFKIVIPSSDREDQSLEITGYEVRVLSPQLSKYILRPSSETSKLAIANAECACGNEFFAPTRTVNLDSAGYSSVIKLHVNHKRSKEKTQARKRSCNSGTTYTEKVTDAKNDSVSEIETQHKSFSNKKTQTDRSYENESIQTLRDMETSKFSPSKSVKDQGCAVDVSSLNEESCRVRILDENDKLISQRESTLKDHPAVSKDLLGHTADPRIDNNSSPVEKFNNTKIFLNVIVRLLESDDTHEISQDLHKTLGTMIDRFQHRSMSAQSARKHLMDDNTNGSVHNDTSTSTQYKSLALNRAPVNRRVEDINSQKSTNKSVGPDNTTAEFRSQTAGLDDTSIYLRAPSLILGEPSNPPNKGANGNKQDSGTVNERYESMNERGTLEIRNEPPASLLDDADMSNPPADSDLNDPDEFFNNEPIASSSRRIEEHGTSSQLAKDFLDVLKYTMMMDGIQQVTENDLRDKDCCKKPNKSTDP